MTEDLRYPIGKFVHEGDIDSARREAWIRDVEQLPGLLAAALAGLSEEQLDTPYREGGWTVRQVAHHLADSHMVCVFRFKLALTEAEPTIQTYEEDAWARLADSSSAPVSLALEQVRGLHARWALLLRSMTEADFARTYRYPNASRPSRLDRTLGLYAWHGRHHTAHITALRERMGWA